MSGDPSPKGGEDAAASGPTRPGCGRPADRSDAGRSGAGRSGDRRSGTAGGPSGVELARQALEQAKADARRRGAAPSDHARRRSGGRAGGSGGGARGGSGDAGRRGGDPARFGAVINALTAERGWQQRLAMGGVFGRWREIVGPELAAHTKPVQYNDGELVVDADSPAWATQLRLLTAQLVRRLNEELGSGSVRKVKVRGPSGPRRSSGPWRVR